MGRTERDFNADIVRLRPRLIAFAGYFIGPGAATPEDMVQDAVVKVWVQINKNGAERINNIEALMMAVLKNICIDYLRLKKNRNIDIDGHKEASKITMESDPLRTLELSDQIRGVADAIKLLPDDQQMVLRLRDIMGYEFEEIASIMEMNEGNIRTLLSRGRKRVREQILAI